MNEKVKCKKCGLLIDEDSKICPYCGYPVHHIDEDKPEPIQGEVVDKPIQQTPKKSFNIFAFETREYKTSIYKQVICFLLGFIGLQFLSLIITTIIKAVNPYYLLTITYQGMVNFAIYSFLFGAFLLILNKDLIPLLSEFKSGKTWLNGIGNGFILIVVTTVVSMLFSLLSTAILGSSTVNNNEAGINSIQAAYPFASLIIFGIIGPICEEFTYRLGFFSLLKRANRVIAYVGVAILFGLIHFDYSATGTALANEFFNLPSYIVAGLLFSYYYDRYGLSNSIIAHVTNNLFAIILGFVGTHLI
jgi:uncharacterized protein